MPQPYSEDLRHRVIAACAADGRTRREIAQQFQISEATLCEYAQRLAERTGRLYSASMLSRVLGRMKLSRNERRYAPRSTSSRTSLPST
jgi:transposase